MGVADLIKKFEKIGGENEDPAEPQNVAKSYGTQPKPIQEAEPDSGDKMHESLEDALPQNKESQEKLSTIERREKAEGVAVSSIEDSECTVSIPIPTESVDISNSPDKLEETGAATTNEERDRQEGVTDATEAVSDDDSIKKKENEEKEEEKEEEEEKENGNQEENAEDKKRENKKEEESGEKSAEVPSSQSSNSKKNKKKKNKKKKKQNAQANAITDNKNDSLHEASPQSSEISIDPKLPGNSRIGRDNPFEFGRRNLTSETDVWDHNAWDNVEWGEEQIKEAEKKISAQHENPVPEFDRKLYNSNPSRYWDIFYKNNKENFFKDRKWLQIEFPSLYAATKKDAGPLQIFEIGCGAGNTFFPILNENENEHLRIVAADFAPRAVELVKSSPQFNSQYGHACVWDLANPAGELPEGVKPHSVDIAVMIFVFSALAPNQWEQALGNLRKVMKPGGKILFRDYGRYDLAQVRFKKNRLLEENFYIRGDGTRVYFFTEEELRNLFTKDFRENKIGTDRRLLVNRKRQLKMYRCWLQAVFEVPQ
ncbi:unnamed protein product [Zygosaccharomyces bailii]|nr:unnamed protein product [Zygosaccharomyces bailii]